MGRLGIVYGLLAYGAWGLLPIYFKLLRAIPPMSIVALRVAFSMIVLIMLAWAARCWPKVRATLRDRRALGLLLASSALIAVNWIFYVYAVNSGHILAGSLGYYLNPFANILLGRFLLKERLSRLQWIAVAIAAVGIAVLAANALGQLWISLILCASFALYGFVRKVVAADALAGLTIENAMLVPFALTWLFYVHVPGTPPIAATGKLSFLVALAGIISTVPLLLFTAAARRLPYSTMGMLQFLAPTIQLLVAVFLYGEPFTSANAIAFAAIWTALALYSLELRRTVRRDLPSAAENVMLAEC